MLNKYQLFLFLLYTFWPKKKKKEEGKARLTLKNKHLKILKFNFTWELKFGFLTSLKLSIQLFFEPTHIC